MTIILALLGAVTGAAVGGAIGFFGYVLLAQLSGADDQQGAIAMGAALAGLPLGGVIGAVLGCVLVLRWRRRTGAPLIGGRQGWAALGITAAIVAGVYGYFFWEPPKPKFKPPASAPIVRAEFRLPADMVDIEFIQGRRSFLRTYDDTYFDSDMVLTPRIEGDMVILQTMHQLLYRRDDRAIHAWVNPGRMVIYELRVGDRPAPTPEFTDWQPISGLRPGFYETDVPEEEMGRVSVRTRVVAP